MLTERDFFTWEKQGELGHIGVRKVTVIERDGEEISRTYHRHVLVPGADISAEDIEVQAVATATWPPEVLQKWAEYQTS